MKKILLYLLFYLDLCLAYELNAHVNVNFHGDLDDDLFIYKVSPHNIAFLDAFQMHNLERNYVLFNGTKVLTKHNPGFLDLNKSYQLKNNEILVIITANEREERDERQELLHRTHYKSVELTVNKQVLFPSLMPENDDVKDYPLWFTSKHFGYNYYQLWENASVNVGLIFPKSARSTIYCLDKEENTISKAKFTISKKFENIKFEKTLLSKIGDHPLMEIDGSVFGQTPSNDELLKKHAVKKFVIEYQDQILEIPLVYPFVYINRIFIGALE
jgi:hypothetical protein